jgi:TPR repeat protein
MRNQFQTGALALVLFLCTQTASVCAGPREDASAAHARGDYTTEARLLRPLAEEGDALAQSLLGLLYKNGEGVPVDYVQAIQWFRKAADQGNASAQFFLGSMYVEGKGVPRDYFQAYVWFNRAAPGNDGVAQLRDSLEKYMTPSQVAEAKRISSELTKEEAEQIFKRGLDMINNCVFDFLMVELGKATTSKQFEALIQDRCGPQQRYVVLLMTQRGGKPGDPSEVAKMQESIDGMRRSIVVNYAQMRRSLHPHASKGKQCQLSEYQCAIQND